MHAPFSVARWAALLLLAPLAWAQTSHCWVAPARAVLAAPGTTAVEVAAASARVAIRDRAATTTLDFELHNPAARDQEAVLLLPVPDGAAVSSFAFDGPAAAPTARILDRDEARRLYDDITRQLRDPALLEFAGLQCLRSSVFPVPAHGRLRVRLAYDHVLEGDGDRVDYVLPRSELMVGGVPWTIVVELQARAPIAVCHSPSHELDVVRRGATALTATVGARSRFAPGAFRLCFATETRPGEPTAVLFACPEPGAGGGHFMLLANAPAPLAARPLRREVTLVLDRSGSMAGPKLAQAKAAALQVLEALADGEGMQILDYGNDVGRAFAAPVAKSGATMAAAREYLTALLPHGGTNIHDALREALHAPALPGLLPLVLFLTDGVPTVGPGSERELHTMVAAANVHARRVFCFGVGHDVNAPLLDRLAEATRGFATYVLPDQDVEVEVARTFARFGHPVLAAPALTVGDDPHATSRLHDLMPRALPDLFAGDQLVLLGRYRGDAPLAFRLRGRGPDGEREFRFTLPVATATTAHAFVPRLWASRQIAFLVDELRQRGGDLGGPLRRGPRVDPFADPRLRELRDEIMRLSMRYGVLGEYTAFFAREGSRLDDWQALTAACQAELDVRAVATRSGLGAISQADNLSLQKLQSCANPRNWHYDATRNVVEVANVQQVCDRAFLRRGDTWIDGNSVVRQQLAPDRRVELGSAEFWQLARRLEGEGRSGVLALRGQILLDVDGRNVLITTGGGSPMPLPDQLRNQTSNQTPKETSR